LHARRHRDVLGHVVDERDREAAADADRAEGQALRDVEPGRARVGRGGGAVRDADLEAEHAEASGDAAREAPRVAELVLALAEEADEAVHVARREELVTKVEAEAVLERRPAA